jgi:hypothetical protein
MTEPAKTDSVADTTTAAVPAPPKPGILTSEAWLSGATAIVGALMASGIWPTDSIYMKVAGILAAALAAFGYSISRGMTKAAYHAAAGGQ